MTSKQKKYHFIYKTTCIITDKYYIGIHSTADLNDGYMGSGRHIKNSLKKYGKNNHKLEILEQFLDRESLIKREEEIVNEVIIAHPSCMNLIKGGTADQNGRTETTIERIRSNTKAAMWRPDVRERYLAALNSRSISEEHVQKIKKANTGRRKTPEEIQKRSASLLLYYQNNEVSKETRNVLSEKSKELWANRTDREIVSKKISKATKAAMWRPDVRERYLAGCENRTTPLGENHYMYGKHHSEETKQKISKSQRGKDRSDEFKQKVSAGMKEFRLKQRQRSPEIKLYLKDKNKRYI